MGGLFTGVLDFADDTVAKAEAAERRAEAQKNFDRALAALDKAIRACDAADRWTLDPRPTDAAVCLEALHADPGALAAHHAARQPCGRWVFPDGSELAPEAGGWAEVP